MVKTIIKNLQHNADTVLVNAFKDDFKDDFKDYTWRFVIGE